jgi:hypothetical protein
MLPSLSLLLAFNIYIPIYFLSTCSSLLLAFYLLLFASALIRRCVREGTLSNLCLSTATLPLSP